MNYFITIIFISVSFGIQADLNNDYGPGSSDFKTDSSGSASAGYDKSVNDNPSRHSNENTGVSRSAPNDSPSSSSSTGSGSSSSNDRGHNHSDDRDDNDDNRNYGYGMDSNDPRSNGNGGYATSAYDITENANRSAHNQYSNNQGYHHEDPWSEYKQYDGGEFGHIGDYQAHEDAIQSAISSADSSCNGKSCQGIERISEINKVYYDELSKKDSNLPQGPMETMVKFRGEEIAKDLNINNNKQIENFMKVIDQEVRAGNASAVLPGQFNIAYPELSKSLSSTQKLGSQGAAVIIDHGSYSAIDQITGIPYAGGLHIDIAGPAGTIILNDNAMSIDTLPHELQHAGEHAIVNEAVNLVGSKDIITSFAKDPTGTVLDLSKHNKDLTPEEISTLKEAILYSAQSLLAKKDRMIVQPGDCLSCNKLPNQNAYYNDYVETRAFVVTSHYDSVDLAKKLEGRTYSASIKLDKLTAQRVAEGLINSPVINDQIETINNAADIISGKKSDQSEVIMDF